MIVAADQYARLRELERLGTPSFKELLLSMPQDDVEFDRLEARMRDVIF